MKKDAILATLSGVGRAIDEVPLSHAGHGPVVGALQSLEGAVRCMDEVEEGPAVINPRGLPTPTLAERKS